MSSDEPTHVRKILLVEVNPRATARVRLTNRLRRILNCLKPTAGNDRFELVIEAPVTITHLQQALLKHRPEIVYFCGHGTGVNGIACEDDSGNIQLIPARAIGDLFRLVKDHVKCVILNACEHEIQANEIVKHIDFVVCINSSIGDEAALKFAEAFYRALFAGEGFAECFDWGVNTMRMANIPEESVPIMKTNPSLSKSVAAKSSDVPVSSGNKVPAPSATVSDQLSAFHRLVAKKPHLFRRMPKKALALLIPVLLLIPFMTVGKEDDIAGYFIQESAPARDLNQPGDGSEYIRCDLVNTELRVFYNFSKRKWQLVEISFWNYYYTPDPKNPQKRYYVGSSKASYLHEEVEWRNGRLLTGGHPTVAQVWIEARDLPGDPAEVAKIKEELGKEAAVVRSRYKESRSIWYLDEARNLMKEKPNKEPEKFVRQRSE